MTSVPFRHRIALSVILGLLCAWATYRAFVIISPHRDFAQVWASAQALLHGRSPYNIIGPSGAFYWKYPLMYPATAGVSVLPLGLLAEIPATVIFSGVAGAAFAWALMEHGLGPLAGFFSASLLAAIEAGQWSPLFVGSIALPWLGVFYAAKPTIGLAYFSARPSWWPIVGGLVLAAIATIMQPTWVRDWFAAIHANEALWAPAPPYRAMVTVPGGALALLALLRWRRPEARLIAALVLVPMTPLPYEAVALFFVPRSAREAALLAAVSWGVQFRIDAVLPHVPNDAAGLDAISQLLALTMYPLATIMVLRRPNEGAAPAWLAQRMPRWLRGETGP
jgi:hypothetical protein